MPESLKLHDAEWLYSVLRRGSRSMRLALLAALPESGFNAPAKVLLESAQPLQTVLAFTQVAGGLCAGVNPALGAQLALATHRYAVELFEASADHAGLVPTTLGLLATQYATASNLLGRSQTTLSFTEHWIPYYTHLREEKNLPGLKVARINALINSHRIDEAQRALDDPTLRGNSATDIEVARLEDLLIQLRGDITKEKGVDAGIVIREPDVVHKKKDVLRKKRKPATGAAKRHPAPPLARSRPIIDADIPEVVAPTKEFDLGVGGGQRAMPPRKQPAPTRVVSTGFADGSKPGEPRDGKLPLKPKAPYFYWLEVGEPVTGVIDAALTSLPKAVPKEAELVVALFAPQGGFAITPEQAVGKLRLQPDGTARVLAQPLQHDDSVPGDLLERRLLFPLRAPARPGQHRLRSSIFCQGVLVQSRLVDAHVGKMPEGHKPAVTSNVDYTLSDTLAPGTLGELEPHELSVMLNRHANGSHDFYFYAGAGAKPFHEPATISADTLDGLITQARVALKMVSWEKGDIRGGEWDKTKTYRYEKPGTIERLQDDLRLLASRGFDIYDAVAENLAGDAEVTALEDALRSPGLLQIAGKQDIRFVLPAGLIY